MKKRRLRRFSAGLMCVILCVALNINPIAGICLAIADSGVVDRFVNLKNNLIYMANTDSDVALASSITPTIPTVTTFECDAMDAASTIMGSGGTTLDDLNSNSDKILQELDSGFTDMASGFTTINGTLENIVTELGSVNKKLETISQQLSEINSNIDSMQHKYNVAHLYSLNNSYANSLWRPYSSDVPYVEDFATVTGKFANVYTGYWDTAVGTLYNPGTGKGTQTERAYEILGYDAIVRSEGIVLNGNVNATRQQGAIGTTGMNVNFNFNSDTTGNANIATLYQEYIPDEKIAWIDAVTLIYKALGQEQVTYQTFMSRDSSITPETSPAFQNLANPIPNDDGSYNGYDFYMFLTRSNLIYNKVSDAGVEPKVADIEYIYWQKALNAGFIPSGYKDAARESITFSQFFKLASRMMQAYGEPVMNDDELKSLLQVYGTHYPIQLGVDIADAWAYLATRGILDFNPTVEGEKSLLYDITYTDYISREQLLTMCMRIKDEDSRTDFKTINVVLNLSDVMKEDYYYPVYDMNLSNGEFESSTTYDHAADETYEYLIIKTDGTSLGDTGVPMVYSEKSQSGDKLVPGAEAQISTVKTNDGKEWYVVSVPKTWTGNFYVSNYVVEGNGSTAEAQNSDVKWIEFPAATLGGGYYSMFSKSGDTATASTESSNGYSSFDGYLQYATRSCTDYLRAGEQKPSGTAVASNATILEKLSYAWNDMTTPMVAYAAEEYPLEEPVNENEILTISYSSDGRIPVDEYETLNEFLRDNGISGTSTTWDATLMEQTGSNQNPDYYSTLRGSQSQDRVTLSRMAALTTWSSPSGDNRPYTTTFTQTPLVEGSLVKGMLSYITGENILTNSYWETLKTRSSSFINSNYKNKSNTSTKIYGPDALITILLMGTNGAEHNAIMPRVRGNETKTNTGQFSFNDAVYGLSNAEYKKFVEENISKFISQEQDALYANWIQNGLKGVKQTSNVSFDIYGTQGAINAINETLADADKLASLANSVASSGDVSMEGMSIQSSVATSTIMDRGEQILISWTDLCNTGYIVNTGSYAQPTLQNNGAYYFMTKEGQVIVNNTMKTIQIGTTLYDLSYDGAPTLVYIDNEQEGEMYFDYRCVMGVVGTQFQRNDTATTEFRNSLGVGNTVVYDLGANGLSSDFYTRKDIRCYNFPDGIVTSSNEACNNYGYTVNLIRSTQYDSDEADGYWNGKSETDLTRLRLATFMPTSNYVVCIDDDGEAVTASLYVYYLRTAFEDGFVEKNGQIGSLSTVDAPPNVDIMFGNVSKQVKDANVSHVGDLTTKLETLYGYTLSDVEAGTTPWYIDMTYSAIASLYEKTGKYYFSADYVVREFKMDNLTWSNTTKWKLNDAGDNNAEISSSDAGAIYWLDGIGFIYNLPSVSEFTLKGYLEGDYLLPLAIDSSGSNPKVINYNMNYYGRANVVNNDTVSSETVIPWGVSLASNGTYVNAEGTDMGVSFAKDSSSSSYTEGGVAMSTTPFAISSGEVITHYNEAGTPEGFIAAPVAIYNKFGGNLLETTTVQDMTQYITDVTKLYLGNTQIRLSGSSSQESTKQFNFMSTQYTPISLDNATKAYRVFRSSAGDSLVIESNGIVESSGADSAIIEMDDYFTNPLEDWLEGIGMGSLLKTIDESTSWLIIFAFRVLPIIGIILMTVLIGLSFIGEIKIVQIISEKVVDPVRILTFGGRNINTWNWRTVLLPCILLYIAFALFLNGNIIRIVMWGAEWYGTLMQWLKSV